MYSNIDQKFENVIWDFNGTLFNDGELNCKLTNKCLEFSNLAPLSFEKYSQLICFPISDFYKKIGLPHEGAKYDDIIQVWKNNYTEMFLNCEFHAGITDLIHQLRLLNHRQFILSALHQELLDKVIKHHGMNDLFADIIGTQSYDGPGKINEGLSLVKKYKLDPDKTILIGDTLHDAEVAQHMGINCILISHGHQDAQTLRNNFPLVVDNIQQLIKFL